MPSRPRDIVALKPSGRAVTAHAGHVISRATLSVSADDVQQRFDTSAGLEPIFRTNDGSNCDNLDVSTLQAGSDTYSLLRTRGLIRIAIDVCHDTANVRNHSFPTPLNIGVGDFGANSTVSMGGLAVSYLPQITVCRVSNPGDCKTTTDLGQVLIDGKFDHVGKLKGPVSATVARDVGNR